MKRLGLLFVTIILVWFAYMGVWFDELIPGYDATAYLIDTSLLKGVNFNFKDYLYRYEILGGTQIYDIYGVPSFLHFYKLLRFLDLHPVTMFNGYIIYYQLMLGYFGMKSVELFREYFYRGEIHQTLWSVAIGLIFSFLTILGLRITHGHVNTELITIPMFFVVVLGFQFNRYSLLDLLATNFVLYTVSPPNGQLAVYTSFFPLFVYIGLSLEIFRKGDKRRLFFSLTYLLVATIASFMIFLPELVDRMMYLKSPDSLRNLSSTRDLVYSYTTHTWRDLVASFSNMLEPIITRENRFLFHETNYPTGILPILIFFLPWKKHRILLTSFLVMTLVIFTFSMDISPFQDIILKLNPILLGFRVPARSISIFVIICFIFSLAVVVEKIDLARFLDRVKGEQKSIQLLGTLLVFALLFAEPILRELLYVTIISVFAFILFKPSTRLATLSYLMLPIVTCTILSSFRERYQISYVAKSTYDDAKTLGGHIKKQFPELQNPLTRITAVGGLGAFGTNLPLLMGLSSIEGYRLLHRRFITTLNDLRGRETANTALFMQYAPDEPNFDLVSNMYNIKGLLISDLDKNSIQVKIFKRKSRPAWFVKEVVEGSLAEAVENKNLFYERAYVLENVNKSIPGTRKQCEHAQVLNMNARFNDQNLQMKISTPTNCPLIIATNYTEKINAYDSDTGKKLLKFPAWGPLLGVMVNKETKSISLRADTAYPGWIDYVSIAGWIMLFTNLAMVLHGLLIPLLPGYRRNRT